MSASGRPWRKKGRPPRVGDVYTHQAGWTWVVLRCRTLHRPNLMEVLTLTAPEGKGVYAKTGAIDVAEEDWCLDWEYTPLF